MVKDIIKTVTFSCMLAGSMFVTCHVCAAGSVVNITGNVQDNSKRQRSTVLTLIYW